MSTSSTKQFCFEKIFPVKKEALGCDADSLKYGYN